MSRQKELNQRQNKDLRQRILEKTRRALIESGYEGLSLRPIARAVGCTATSIYLHFQNKDELIHSLIDEGMETLYHALRQATQDITEREERLQCLCRAYVDFGLQNPEYYEIMFNLRPERMERFPAPMYRKARRNLDLGANILMDIANPGAEESHEVQSAMTLAWTSLHGLVSLIIARRIDVSLDQEELIERGIEQTTRGLEAAFVTREG